MSNAPHNTLKFAKVVPLETPSPQSAAPEAYEEVDEIPTLPGAPGTNNEAVRAARASKRDRAVLTVMSGLTAGRIFAVEQDETVIGRARDVGVHIDDASISRRHARILRVRGGRHILQDLGSTNGVFVNGQKVQRVELFDGDRVQVGPTIVFRFGFVAADEEAVARQLYESSTRDPLTHVYNRKHANERLDAEVAYANRHGTLLGVAILDLDHFKRINDSFGHLAGDGVLRVVSAQVQKSIRAEDVLARYGGEEFIVLARGIQHQGVGVLAERLRKGVERLSIPWNAQILKATVSVGVASISECRAHPTVEALVALADERLYRAKAAGRNRVCVQ